MKKLLFILSFLFALSVSATHIVGGEMIYDDLGNGNYRITLKCYRDCKNGLSPFDGDGPNAAGAYITVYDGLQNYINVYDMGSPVITHVPPSFNNPCVLTPNTVCIDQGIYTYTLNLPPTTGGYYIVYQRCCRNAGINNIVTPGLIGTTYYTHIPGPETVTTNSSPRFKNLPPIYVCNSLEFTFDHSAIDPDGDVLKYSFCAPFQGLDGCCGALFVGPPPTTNSNCISPPSVCPSAASLPPYTNVIFQSPYSGSYPIASNPAFSINPTTGILSGVPTTNGLWVFGICVEEYRGGQLIDMHMRDFQITVFNCSVTTVASIPQSQFNKCQGLTVTFGNNSSTSGSIPLTYHWDFGIPGLTNDTSDLATPTYNYPDTGTYVVTLIANPGKVCSDTQTQTVFVYEKFDIEALPVKEQCLKNNSFSFSVTTLDMAATTFTWHFTSGATPSVSSSNAPSNIVFNQAGIHIYNVVGKQRSCLDTIIDTLRIIGRPIAKINNLPDALCDPARLAFSNGSSCELPLKYFWQFSNGNTSTAFEPIQVFTPAGVYSVSLTAITDSICVDTNMVSIINVTVNPSPFAGFTFSPQVTTIFDPEIRINNSASHDVLYWQYLFGDGAGSPYPYNYHIYEDYGNYSIQQIVTNKFGCKDTIEQVVKILPEFRFWIPNAFTPDKNSLNDVFMPIVIGVADYKFEIFDRWGELIFKTNDIKQGWNGFYKSKECKQDIYVWHITFKNIVSEKNEVHYGHVTLLQNQ